MKKLGNYLFLSLVASVILAGTAWAQTFNATVNRTDVPQGETFVLTLELIDGDDKGNPDLSVLDKDFIVYSVGTAFNYKYINGVSSKSRQWQIALMPKNSGSIEIPSIQMDNLATQPITLNVIPANQALSAGQNNPNQPAQNANRPKFDMVAKVENTSPYVQQQIDYTITIYDTGGLQGDAPQFIDDGSNDWIIKSLGSPTIGSKIVNGRSLREITFRYALFPQKSGTLKTPEVRFQGYYLTRSRGFNDPFDDLFGGNLGGIGFADMFATRNPVLLTAAPQSIQVRPIPSENGANWWLPAKQVALMAEWEPRQPQFKVGEAVSRTIYLKAVGVAENQLPDIRFAQTPDLKQYPDKAISSSGLENGQVVAVKKITNVYIPTTSGAQTIPEIALDWFNVQTNQMERAVLPAVNIEVMPSAGLPAAQPQAAQPSLPQTGQAVAPKSSPMEDFSDMSIPGGNSNLAYVIAIAAFLVGIIFSWLIFGRRRPHADEIKDYDKYIIKSLKHKDYRALRDGLVAWGRERWHNDKITNLKEVAKAAQDKEFGAYLDELGALLYAQTPQPFNEKGFLKSFEKVRKSKIKSAKEEQPLPKLYK